MIRRTSISVNWRFSANAERLGSSEITVLNAGSGLIVPLAEGHHKPLIYNMFLFE